MEVVPAPDARDVRSLSDGRYGPPGPPAEPHPTPPRPGRHHVAAVVATLVLVAVAVLGGRQLWYWWRLPSVSLTPTPSPYAGGPANMDAIAAATAPALVDVATTLADGTRAAGTGMVIDSGGGVLTNNHVIEGALSISVTDVGNGRTYAATVVGYNRSADVAVLRLTGASGLKTVELGDSSRVRVGDGVVAIGNAHGVGGAPVYSGGHITATNRTINAEDQADGSTQTLTGLLETDAPIVSGDSGGALVDTSGEVIGMITAGSAGFRFQAGYGYAIPVNRALAVARQIVSASSPISVRTGPAPSQYPLPGALLHAR